MAAPMTAAQTRTAMAKWDVPVVFRRGWETHGRPGRTWGPINGIVIHHTGSDTNTTGYVNGLFNEKGMRYPSLPGPLCQASTGPDGVTVIGAAGRSNHAGQGAAHVLASATDEDYDGYSSELRPGTSKGPDGNARFYGNEVRFSGAHPMTAKQYEGVVLWCCAILDHYGWSALSVIAHREWTSAKPDPGKTSMAKLRSDIRARLKAGPIVAETVPPVAPSEPTPEPVPCPPPAPLEATADFRTAYFNINGGYTTKGGTWKQRLPLIVATMLKSKSSVYLLGEAHEERREQHAVLAELEKHSHDRWVLLEGDGGNHAIADGSKWKLIKTQQMRLPHGRDCTFWNLFHVPTGVRVWTWNTHLIASDADKCRTRAEAAEMRADQARTIAGRLKSLQRCVGGGDANDEDYSVGSLRQVIREVGHDDFRTKTPNVSNARLNSHDGYTRNEREGGWIDLLAVGQRATVVDGGLIDSGNASDHNLIHVRTTITGPVTTLP